MLGDFPKLPAEEAHRIGLAQWLVPHAKLMDKALEVAADASLVDLYRFAALELTEDKAEGHRAWREKRKPAFRGR